MCVCVCVCVWTERERARAPSPQHHRCSMHPSWRLQVQEIQSLLDEDITPTLEKLRKERSSYLEYQKTKAEIDLLTRFLVAWSFQRAEVGKQGACVHVCVCM